MKRTACRLSITIAEIKRHIRWNWSATKTVQKADHRNRGLGQQKKNGTELVSHLTSLVSPTRFHACLCTCKRGGVPTANLPVWLSGSTYKRCTWYLSSPFPRGRGTGRPLPCSGSSMLHFISVPCTCNAVSEGTEPGRHARGRRGKPSLNRRALSSSRWGQRALSGQVP